MGVVLIMKYMFDYFGMIGIYIFEVYGMFENIGS